MFEAQVLLLFTVVSALIGIDLARQHPAGAAGMFILAVHSLIFGFLLNFDLQVPASLWWVTIIMFPAAFWLLAVDLMHQTKGWLPVYLVLFAFQGLWFTAAVYIMVVSGGQPSLPMALGLGLTYGIPLQVGLWAVQGADRSVTVSGPPSDAWPALLGALLAGLLMASLLHRTGSWLAASFFFAAGLWAIMRHEDVAAETLDARSSAFGYPERGALAIAYGAQPSGYGPEPDRLGTSARPDPGGNPTPPVRVTSAAPQADAPVVAHVASHAEAMGPAALGQDAGTSVPTIPTVPQDDAAEAKPSNEGERPHRAPERRSRKRGGKPPRLSW